VDVPRHPGKPPDHRRSAFGKATEDATEFRSSEDPSHLTIRLCGGCLQDAAREGRVLRLAAVGDHIEYSTWNGQ
jgi:hypothetical protein